MRKVQIIFAVWMILAAIIYVLHGSKAAAAMFIVAALYCIAALILVFVSGKKMTVEIRGESGVDKNKPAEVTISAANHSRMPVPACLTDVSCRNVLTGEEQTIPMKFTCGPKSKKKSSFTVTSKYCGKEDIKITRAVVSDPAGLFVHDLDLNAGTAVYVMPEIKGVEIPSEYLDSYDMESYAYSQLKKGSDPGEVFGIREYADGDSPKQIHWKLSAKMDDLMVKIPSYPIENKLVILLDNSLAESVYLSADRRNDLMELFFSISSSLLKKNITHSLGWCDHSTGSFVVKRVENENDMWSSVPEALSAGIEHSELSTAYKFLESYGEEHFNNHFIVTASEPAETDLLAQYGEVRVFTL